MHFVGPGGALVLCKKWTTISLAFHGSLETVRESTGRPKVMIVVKEKAVAETWG